MVTSEPKDLPSVPIAPPKRAEANLLSLPWLKDKFLQTATIGGVATVIAAVLWAAGYLVVLRRALTFGIPNLVTAPTAYQQAGADWALDSAAAIREAGSAAGRARLTFTVLALAVGFVLLRIGLPRVREKFFRSAIAVFMIGLHIVLALIVSSSSLRIWDRLEASDLLGRERTEIQRLNVFAQSIVSALVTNDASVIRADYRDFVVQYVSIAGAAVLLAWAIRRNFKPSRVWRRRLIGAQLLLGLFLFTETALLAEFYGLVTSISMPRCAIVAVRPELAETLRKTAGDARVTALILSDLAFGGDEVHLLQPGFNSVLYVFKRSDIIKYEFHERADCAKFSF
jgi:hypothetical protein